ncbi:MAG: hypothetical protein JWM61_1380 [Micrococcaceae bacterium]|jgi:hypothetical protein|uniref:hypothetical protein n=1 Tax=Arthrobacter sp. PL16 TaxID=3071720 RepID=UPI002E03CA98|nr:hypothetical protein [Micrococcaceae bacterium]MEC5198884.1 hypothetical protein [Arthrobacter sp. PL16]
MSTPQDTPGNRNDDGQAWNPPGGNGSGHSPDGQQGKGQQAQPTPYGRQDVGSPYGYQAAQPSGYAYPSSGGDAGRTEKGPAPKEVMRAYYLILAAGAAYLVSSIISSLTAEIPDMAGASLGVGVGLVFAVLFAAVYVVLAVFIRKGQNWARITATVLATLNVLLVLGGLLLLPIANRAVEASGQTIPPISGFSTALDILVMLLGVAGVVMTYLKPARPYFAPQRLGY